MRILVVGGSSFVGRHIVGRALAAGHEVTMFNRGVTNPGLFPAAEHRTGDRNADLSALADGEWDATVDTCAYVPRQVRTLHEALGARGGLYALVSSVSAYPLSTPRNFTEDAPLLTPSFADTLTMDLYGALKVGCELTAAETFGGDRTLVIRPGYIVGPNDPTHRFTYWVERVTRGGRILGPRAEQPMQVIDVRDLASFTVSLLEQGWAGAVHTVAPWPAMSFAEMLHRIAEGVGNVDLDVRWNAEHDLLPLTDAEDGGWSLMTADPSLAVSRGLSWRPLEETAADTLRWIRAALAEGLYNEQRPGLMTPDEEAEILASLD